MTMKRRSSVLDSRPVTLFILVLMAALMCGCRTIGRGRISRILPKMGHRNWIVVADSAYPAQNKPGIETVVTGRGQLEMVQAVLDAVDKAPHVQPVVYLDSELDSVSEVDAPGIRAYRNQLGLLLKKRTVRSMPHERLIGTLDEAAEMFSVMVFKTDMTLPYTSVFIELESGYWNADAEKRLRDKMKQMK
jgi:D-ribose pyranose/furanose isomerase RbsD